MGKLILDKRMLEYELMKSYPNISCFSTTRYGGHSTGLYSSFNCTHYCGDDDLHVQKNKEELMSLLVQRPLALAVPEQIHGTCVKILSSVSDVNDLDGFDALVTQVPGICLCVSTADCIPVLLYDTRNQVVAAAHAGWRGTVERIVEKVLDEMARFYGTRGEDVKACIGPGISLEAFEVGDEVYAAFEKAGFKMSDISCKYKKWHIDLWEANRLQLLDKKVGANNIELAGICTYKEYMHFFSARRLGVKSGRILSGIMLHQMR